MSAHINIFKQANLGVFSRLKLPLCGLRIVNNFVLNQLKFANFLYISLICLIF